jgi:hypothetical protein
MSSPFPGMDPFIEFQEWEDFHTRAITLIGDALGPEIQPRYVARVERRIYVESEPGGANEYRIADVAVTVENPNAKLLGSSAMVATIDPIECLLSFPGDRIESYLEIRDSHSKEVVTVIELLSPSNKRRNSDGRRQYIEKRSRTLLSGTNLVEIDLLRNGLRLPTLTDLPVTDYYVFVSRGHRRPRAEVYAWNLEQRLPRIPIPLEKDVKDAAIDLQEILNTVYDRARYDLSIDYAQGLLPPLATPRAQWLSEVLAARRMS